MFSKNLGTVRIFIPNFEMFDHLKIVRIFYISFFKTHEDMLKMFLRTSETESNNSYTSSFFFSYQTHSKESGAMDKKKLGG